MIECEIEFSEISFGTGKWEWCSSNKITIDVSRIESYHAYVPSLHEIKSTTKYYVITMYSGFRYKLREFQFKKIQNSYYL